MKEQVGVRLFIRLCYAGFFSNSLKDRRSELPIFNAIKEPHPFYTRDETNYEYVCEGGSVSK